MGDNGTFGGVTNLSNDTAGSVNPDISASNGTLHAVWGENTPGNNSIIARTSNDSGLSFDKKVVLVTNDSLISHPQIVASGNDVLIVASAQNKSGSQNIIQTKSSNGGKTFEGIDLAENKTKSENKTLVTLTGPQSAVPGQEVSFYAQVGGMNQSAEYYFKVSGPQIVDIPVRDNHTNFARFKMPNGCVGNADEKYLIDATGVENRVSDNILLICRPGQNFVLRSSVTDAVPGNLVNVSGIISGLPRQEQRIVDIYPSPSKLNITKKSSCLDVNNSSCYPPYVEYLIPKCNYPNETRLTFQGYVLDLYNRKFSNETSISISCSVTSSGQPTTPSNLTLTSTNNPPQANDSEYTAKIGTPVTIDLKQFTSDKDQDSLTARVTEKPFYGDIDDSNINSSGVIVYSPHNPSNSSSGPALPAGGDDSFKYNVFDGKQYSNDAIIKIKIVPLAHPSQASSLPKNITTPNNLIVQIPMSVQINNPTFTKYFSVWIVSNQRR